MIRRKTKKSLVRGLKGFAGFFIFLLVMVFSGIAVISFMYYQNYQQAQTSPWQAQGIDKERIYKAYGAGVVELLDCATDEACDQKVQARENLIAATPDGFTYTDLMGSGPGERQEESNRLVRLDKFSDSQWDALGKSVFFDGGFDGGTISESDIDYINEVSTAFNFEVKSDSKTTTYTSTIRMSVEDSGDFQLESMTYSKN